MNEFLLQLRPFGLNAGTLQVPNVAWKLLGEIMMLKVRLGIATHA
jgi:hypothetical protein